MTSLTRQVLPASVPLRYRLIAFAVAYGAMLVTVRHFYAESDVVTPLQRSASVYDVFNTVTPSSYWMPQVNMTISGQLDDWDRSKPTHWRPICNSGDEPVTFIGAAYNVTLAPGACDWVLRQ